VASLAELEKVARVRAEVEGERRYCGSKSREPTGAPVELSTNEKLESLLDARTVKSVHLKDRKELMRQMKGLLKGE
jgi:hypothetical protein